MATNEQIKNLIRSGERARAINLLKVLIQLEPENPEAWWLLSFANEDPQKQQAAIERLLQLRPSNSAARQRLAQLRSQASLSKLRQQAAPAVQQPALSQSKPTLLSTPTARIWTGALALLFVFTVGSAFLLNNAIRANAAALQAEVAIANLGAAPSELPPIVVVLPSETPTSELLPTTTTDSLAAAQPTEQPTATSTPAIVTPEPTADDLPVFDEFVQSLVTGDGNERVGVFVENLFSYPIVQQPANDLAWITSNSGEVTEFRIVRQHTGNEGLIAHNYLAGGQFYSLRVGDIVELVLGDGSVIEFEIYAIEDYQALSPNSPTSDFLSLATGDKLSASDLFYRVYGGHTTLTFQTCINRDNLSTWGRTFIIGEEL